MVGREGPANPDNFLVVKQLLVDGDTLDVGAGEVHPHVTEGDVTLDVDVFAEPDMVHDLEDGIPFPDGAFSNVTAIHVLEHLEGDVAAWDEMRRVAEARAIAIVPIGPRPDADHVHVYTRESALERFEHDTMEVSSDPRGLYDLVLVAETG